MDRHGCSLRAQVPLGSPVPSLRRCVSALTPGLGACSKRHSVFLLSSRRLQASAWLVFAGIIAHGSIKQEAGVSVEKIIYHPLYNDSSLDYDIALMKLQVPLNFSGKMLLHPPPVWSCLS